MGIILTITVVWSINSFYRGEIGIIGYTEMSWMVREFPELQKDVQAFKLNTGFIDRYAFWSICDKYEDLKYSIEVNALMGVDANSSRK